MAHHQPRKPRHGPCIYCRVTTKLTKEHIVPRSKLAQPLGPKNVAYACGPCNSLKANMSAAELRDLAGEMRSVAGRASMIARAVDKLIRDRGLPG